MNDVMTEKGTMNVSDMMSSVDSVVQSSAMHITLPTGYLDADGVLHKELDIRPYTGEEEDLLASSKMPIHRRLGKLLENCTTRIGDIESRDKIGQAIRSLVFSDRLFLLVQIRIATNGPIYSLEQKCADAECGKVAMQHIDLNTIEWKGMPEPSKRQFSCKLPGSGDAVTWNVLDGKREEKIHQHSMSKDLLSVGLFGRLNDINGKQVTMELIKKMTPSDRRFLRTEFSKYEGKLDEDVEFECPECAHIWKGSVDYAQASFFFPTGEQA